MDSSYATWRAVSTGRWTLRAYSVRLRFSSLESLVPIGIGRLLDRVRGMFMLHNKVQRNEQSGVPDKRYGPRPARLRDTIRFLSPRDSANDRPLWWVGRCSQQQSFGVERALITAEL